MKNPEDGDFHTSGDSTAEFNYIYYCLEKGVPRFRHERVVFALQATDESLYEK